MSDNCKACGEQLKSDKSHYKDDKIYCKLLIANRLNQNRKLTGYYEIKQVKILEDAVRFLLKELAERRYKDAQNSNCD